MAYYAVLAAKGFVPVDWLPGFGAYDSPLGHHPDRVLVPGAEIGSGSLGHGLPIAVGTALGLRAQGRPDPAVWVLIGDAELDEGSNHEAIAFAGPAGLDRLHAVVIDNSSASHALPGGIAARFEAAGWSAVTVDGRDHEALHAAFNRGASGPAACRRGPCRAEELTSPALRKGHTSMDTMRDRFAPVVSRLLDEDPRVAVVLAEIGRDGFREAERRHPDRVINVGIREQLLIGTAAGLALTGLRPVVHTFASFLVERPFEQVKLDLGHQDTGAVLVSAAASFDWPAGGCHPHGPRRRGPPGHPGRLDRACPQGIRTRPETLLHHAGRRGRRQGVRAAVRAVQPAGQGDRRAALRHTVREGRSRVSSSPSDRCWDTVLAATEGLDVTVLYATTVRPFDAAGLRRATDAAGTDVVLVEPYLAGTSTAAVSEALSDVPHRVLRPRRRPP
ncbi:hypothetical protein GCM10017687_78630 [Streptomyces echinatus]